MTYCVSDDFVRDRNKGSVNIVKEWIKHSGYDRTRPLRAEIGSARDKGSLKCFTEEGCIRSRYCGEHAGCVSSV